MFLVRVNLSFYLCSCSQLVRSRSDCGVQSRTEFASWNIFTNDSGSEKYCECHQRRHTERLRIYWYGIRCYHFSNYEHKFAGTYMNFSLDLRECISALQIAYKNFYNEFKPWVRERVVYSKIHWFTLSFIRIFQVHPSEWQETLTGLPRRERILSAAKVIANLYKNASI